MSLKACSRIVRACGVASSPQFLARSLPRRVGERSLYLKQDKRSSTKEELGMLIFGLGALSTAAVWVRKSFFGEKVYLKLITSLFNHQMLNI